MSPSILTIQNDLSTTSRSPLLQTSPFLLFRHSHPFGNPVKNNSFVFALTSSSNPALLSIFSFLLLTDQKRQKSPDYVPARLASRLLFRRSKNNPFGVGPHSYLRIFGLGLLLDSERGAFQPISWSRCPDTRHGCVAAIEYMCLKGTCSLDPGIGF